MSRPRAMDLPRARPQVAERVRPTALGPRPVVGEPAKAASRDDRFADELLTLIPFMRAVARGLTPVRSEADDIVQEALLKAWAKRDSFQLGTSMKAWTATIVRNYYREICRRSWRMNQLDDSAAEELLVANDDPSARLDLDDVRRAIYVLPLIHREVLMLLAGGLSYDEVSQVCGCAEGTVKSRASRARRALAAIVEGGRPGRDAISPSLAMDHLIHDIRTACSELRTS